LLVLYLIVDQCCWHYDFAKQFLPLPFLIIITLPLFAQQHIDMLDVNLFSSRYLADALLCASDTFYGVE
jgi:hypothetical protein